MKPRFQADADLNRKIVAGLRRREPTIDFQDAHAGDVIGSPDPDVLARAAGDGRVLVSHDRRTMLKHFAHFIKHQTSPGLIIVSQDLDVGQANRRSIANLGGHRGRRVGKRSVLRALVKSWTTSRRERTPNVAPKPGAPVSVSQGSDQDDASSAASPSKQFGAFRAKLIPM